MFVRSSSSLCRVPLSRTLNAARVPMVLTQTRSIFRPQKHRFNEENHKCLYPFMSTTSFERHFEMVYLGGYKKLNSLIQGTHYLKQNQLHQVVKMASTHLGDVEIFNAAAHLRNHQIFFDSLVPWDFTNADKALSKNTRRELLVQFNGLEGMKEQFLTEAKKVAANGSGWLWLINRNSHLEILATHNNATPEALGDRLIPIFCLDLWEHSFVDDYGADVEAYIDAFWHVLNWEKVEERCVYARRTMLFLTDKI